MASTNRQAINNMQKIPIRTGLVALLLVCCAISSLGQATFKPAEVTSAPDIPYPIQSIANGVVVLDVSLDAKGAIEGLNIVRDIPSLTSAVTSSIPSWKFSPALLQGKPETSVMRIAVVFRPRSYLAAGPAFTAILSEGNPDHTRLSDVLPGITSVVYPQYPVNAAVPWTVVIQVTVGKTGAIQRAKLVRDLPPFSQFALNALNRWRFQSATLDGKPVASNLAIAFIFAPLPSGE
jgi:outer membrane biosynthesis protein TonB